MGYFLYVAAIAVIAFGLWAGYRMYVHQQELAEKAEEFQKYYTYVMTHGTEAEKQTALLAKMTQDIEALKGLAVLDIFFG